MLKWPLVLIAGAFVLQLALFHVADTFTERVRTGFLGTACAVPLVPWVFPACASLNLASTHMAVDFPALMKIQGDSMDVLLEESVGMAAVGWDLKQSEMAASDLITLIKISDLTSRSLLADALEDLLIKAKFAAKSLRRLDSSVNFATDRSVFSLVHSSSDTHEFVSILAVNDHALNTLAAAAERHFLGSSDLASPEARVSIQRSFTFALDKFVDRLSNVFIQCEGVLMLFDELDRGLGVIHEIVSRERITLTEERDDLLAALWTFLGGNKAKLRALNNHLVLLLGLSKYRSKAFAHVHRTMQAVAQMQEDVAHLRNETVLVAVGAPVIDMRLQLASLRAGIARLAEGRARTKVKADQIRHGAFGGMHDE